MCEYINMNEIQNLEAKAKRAIKNPTIKKLIKCQNLLMKYSHRWEWELSSDRMQEWAAFIRNFEHIQNFECLNPKYSEVLDLWEAYCEDMGESTSVSVQDCLC